MYEAELGLNPKVHSPHGAAAGNIQLGAQPPSPEPKAQKSISVVAWPTAAAIRKLHNFDPALLSRVFHTFSFGNDAGAAEVIYLRLKSRLEPKTISNVGK